VNFVETTELEKGNGSTKIQPSDMHTLR